MTAGAKLSAGVRDALTDQLFEAAKGVLKRAAVGDVVTAATFQNALHIGYNRASWFLEAMEHLGLVGPKDPYNRRIVVALPGAKSSK